MAIDHHAGLVVDARAEWAAKAGQPSRGTPLARRIEQTPRGVSVIAAFKEPEEAASVVVVCHMVEVVDRQNAADDFATAARQEGLRRVPLVERMTPESRQLPLPMRRGGTQREF
jgi:hypothetical protein